MGGPGYGLSSYTTGVAIANEGITWVVLALAIFAILHVVRHTRAEEETGRAELVRAAVVGRHARVVAAVLTLVVVHAVIAVLSAGAMTGVSGAELDLTNALATTVGSGLSAMVFGAVAVVVCQLADSARAGPDRFWSCSPPHLWSAPSATCSSPGEVCCRGCHLSPRPSSRVLRGSSVVAGPADRHDRGLLWLGAVLASRRDSGGGMIASRGGRADARSWLRRPLALAWLQQRKVLLWCCIGLGLMWFASGTLMPEIDTMIGSVTTSNPVWLSRCSAPIRQP